MVRKTTHRQVDKTKQNAILAAARAEFLEVGYTAASIERIAANANVSKVTVYNQFAGKEKLFAAIVEGECRNMRAMLPDLGGSDRSIRDELLNYAKAIMQFWTSPSTIRFERRMAAEVERSPELGELFLNAGPRPIRAMLSEMIAVGMDRGRLARADPRQAAAHLYGIIKGFSEVEARFSDPDTAAQLIHNTSLEAAVDRFLLAYKP